jgi:hypothetical protein
LNLLISFSIRLIEIRGGRRGDLLHVYGIAWSVSLSLSLLYFDQEKMVVSQGWWKIGELA